MSCRNKSSYVMLGVICHHLRNIKNLKNTPGRVLILAKLQAEAYNFTKSNTPPWVFLTFLRLHKWHRTAQSISYVVKQEFSFKLQLCLFVFVLQTFSSALYQSDQTT